MIESKLLEALLLGVIDGATGTAASVTIWWFIKSGAGQKLRNRLAAWLGYFGLEQPEVTRYLAMALSVVASLAIHIVGNGRLSPWALFAIIFIGSQICHARRKTRLALHQKADPIDPITSTWDLTYGSNS